MRAFLNNISGQRAGSNKKVREMKYVVRQTKLLLSDPAVVPVPMSLLLEDCALIF